MDNFFQASYRMSFAAFFGMLSRYLSRLPPVLAPWRDTGEMTVAAATLGDRVGAAALYRRALAPQPLADTRFDLR